MIIPSNRLVWCDTARPMAVPAVALLNVVKLRMMLCALFLDPEPNREGLPTAALRHPEDVGRPFRDVV